MDIAEAYFIFNHSHGCAEGNDEMFPVIANGIAVGFWYLPYRRLGRYITLGL